MNNADKKTDLLIKKLRNQKPELSDESLLTDNIMAQIRSESEPEKQSGHSENIIAQTTETANRRNLRVFLWIRAISTAAAVFFLVLYIFQGKNTDKSFADESKEIAGTNISKIKPPCLINAQTSVTEAYSCYLEYSKSKNKQTFVNYINKIKNNYSDENF